MKDKVFIIWSGSKEVAIKIADKLRARDYFCEVGGNHDNNSEHLSVNATVIDQMNRCNQAIAIFQNKATTGRVAENLIFELGYVLARYGARKLHCVKRLRDEIKMPSDFDNSFIEGLNDESEEAFVNDVVKYFSERQKLAVEENKMSLIGRRYKMKEFIESHYSSGGAHCSDYELAQYMLFYMSAAQIFGEEEKVMTELFEFKKQYQSKFSLELMMSVNECYYFLKMLTCRKSENNEVYIDTAAYTEFMKQATDIDKKIVNDIKGPFDEWARFILEEQMAYACLLYSGAPKLSDKIRLIMHQSSIKYGFKSLESAVTLSKSVSAKDNNDNIGLIKLLRSYVYRNLFLSNKFINEHKDLLTSQDEKDFDYEAESLKWLEICLTERRELVLNYGNGVVDSGIYENFRMEYYLILAEYLTTMSIEKMDMMDYFLLKSELSSYMEDIKANGQKTNVYIEKIFGYYIKMSDPED